MWNRLVRCVHTSPLTGFYSHSSSRSISSSISYGSISDCTGPGAGGSGASEGADGRGAKGGGGGGNGAFGASARYRNDGTIRLTYVTVND